MSDGDEVVNGMQLAFEEAKKLYAKDPEHELLRFFTEGNKKAIYKEFQDRFGKKDITEEQRKSYPAQAYFYAQYFLALKKAVDGEPESTTELPAESECSKDEIPQNTEDPF